MADRLGSRQAVALADLLGADGVSGGVVGIGLLEFFCEAGGPQGVQGLIEGLKIVGGHDDRGDPAVPGDLNDFVSGVSLVN
jgi:hypothetical protein